VLSQIYAAKAAVSAREEELVSEDRVRHLAAAGVAQRRPFIAALRRAARPAIIAEIKRASPSAGSIAPNVDVARIAQAYEAAGATAISVVTETDHFLGDLTYLEEARRATGLPLLRKDFLWTSYHVAQSAAFGADALLLIVAGISDEVLQARLDDAQRYALDVVVEVHDDAELRRAVRAGAQLIGVNNRNLSNLSVDLGISEMLLPKIPAGIYALSESGIGTAADAVRMVAAGAEGLLIGETLMRSDSPEEFIGAVRRACSHEAVR
jgi:indole-3-glycerol phosphate synthase